MILKYKINNNIEINNLSDLNKLKPLIDNGLKVNKSDIARKLNVDRRTVDKYIKGFSKSKKRNRKSKSDKLYDTIKGILDNKLKVFSYKRVLWQYLVENYNIDIPESSFRRYISKHVEFNSYFSKSVAHSTKGFVSYETEAGKQAQLDWKESIEFVLNTIKSNI